jgi:hypothetical protein
MIAAQSIATSCMSARRLGRRRLFVVMTATALLSVAVGTSPPNAHAAAYSVWACADGSGRLLPDGDWTEVRDGAVHFVRSTCGNSTADPATHLLAVAATGPGNASTDSGAGWRVQAAPGTTIAGFDVWWAGGTPSFSTIPGRIELLAPHSIFRVDGPNGDIGAYFGIEAKPWTNTVGFAYDERNHSAFRNLSAPSVTLKAWCVSTCEGAPGIGGQVFVRNVAYFEAYRVRTLVEDATAPVGSSAGLEDGARVSEPTTVHTDVTDVGGGVREVSLRVDGRVVDRAGAGEECGDVDATNADPYEYVRMQPCPRQRSVSLRLLPADLGDGERHLVSVVASDAAGQETVIKTSRAALATPAGYFGGSGFFNPDLDVVAPRALNGVHAGPAGLRLSFVVGRGTRRRFADRRVAGTWLRPRIGGRLTSASGAPISGARVWCASTVATGRWQISGRPLTTSPTGRVSGRLPAKGPNRDVRLVYFPYSDSSENVQSPSRRLTVRASTTIHLDQARYRNGETVHFSGRITTTPLIRRKSVYVQVVVRGRWRTFDTTRADSAGGWKLRYRFTATRRPTAYRFRAVVPADAGYPWATGHSRAVRVVVSP